MMESGVMGLKDVNLYHVLYYKLYLFDLQNVL